MEKFTKGEWEIKPVEDDKEYIRIRGTVLGGMFKICDVNDAKFHHKDSLKWCEMEREESMANANLIKSSPKMYRKLNDIANFLFETGGIANTQKAREIEMVLAEARGEL